MAVGTSLNLWLQLQIVKILVLRKLCCHKLCDYSPKEVKKSTLKVDWETCISTASQHNSAAVVASICHQCLVAETVGHGLALDHDPQGTAVTVLQALYHTPTIGQGLYV